MSYENLATKYRPGNLTEVMGQETIKQTLQNAVKLGRIAHSYVFYGPRGCGKTTIARILAMTLNCHRPKDGAPCGKCASCVEIAESKSLDVLEIDAASNTGVDKVRSVIIEQVSFAPSRDKYKIYILDEVHMLSTGAFNALLKTVEEPPAHVVFIMATTEQNKVPLTILSRSQCFRFRPISEADIIARLKEITAAEKIKTEPEALKIIARSAGGAMRDAITLLDRAASFGHGEVKTGVLNELLGHPGDEVVNTMALALVKRDAAALHSAFDRLNAEGHDPLAALRDLRNNFAEAFLAAQGFSKDVEPVKGLPPGTPPALLARLSRKLSVIIEEVKFSDALPIAAEMALFTLIEVPQDLEGLLKKLEGLEARLSSGDSPEPPPAGDQKKNDALASPHFFPGPGQSAGQAPQADTRGGTAAAAAPVKQAVSSPVTAETARPQPTVPKALAPHFGPGTGKSAGPADAWKKMLGQVSSKMPGLYNVMLSVRIVFSEENKWRLLSSNKFETGMIERSRVELEGMLERYAGRKITLVPECAALPVRAAKEPDLDDSGPAAPGEEETMLEDSLEAEAAQEAAAAPKPEGHRQVSAGTEPELKHLNKVFHGRITKITKVK
ncbi:MAG: DNA polymerase III subunit gamma/tau [Elusimicrobiota bacterium]|nr:DNA polymerase III subunit gamma/tau [Elusimicrobiota bacterium]